MLQGCLNVSDAYWWYNRHATSLTTLWRYRSGPLAWFYLVGRQHEENGRASYTAVASTSIKDICQFRASGTAKVVLKISPDNEILALFAKGEQQGSCKPAKAWLDEIDCFTEGVLSVFQTFSDNTGTHPP